MLASPAVPAAMVDTFAALEGISATVCMSPKGLRLKLDGEAGPVPATLQLVDRISSPGFDLHVE